MLKITRDKYGIKTKKYGKYVKFLGEGVNSKVFQYSRQDQEFYAVKFIKVGKADNLKDIQGSTRYEYELIRYLNSKISGIVQVYELYDLSLVRIDGETYKLAIVFEYLPTKLTLRYITELPFEEKLAIAMRLINIMRSIHAQRVAHLDLKLSNILIDENKQLKLIDFSASRRLDVNYDNKVDEGGKIVFGLKGTKNYCSPEMLRSLKYNGYKADSWSLGVILVIILTAKLPYWFDNLGQFNDFVNNGEIKTIDEFADLTSLERDSFELSIIRKLLVVDPIKRLDILDIGINT